MSRLSLSSVRVGKSGTGTGRGATVGTGTGRDATLGSAARAVTPRSSAGRCCVLESKPVAMTVMWISSLNASSITAPKMILASGCAVLRMISAASFTSNRVRSGPPVTLKRMPRAPSMVTSSSELAIAFSAASAALLSP